MTWYSLFRHIILGDNQQRETHSLQPDTNKQFWFLQLISSFLTTVWEVKFHWD